MPSDPFNVLNRARKAAEVDAQQPNGQTDIQPVSQSPQSVAAFQQPTQPAAESQPDPQPLQNFQSTQQFQPQQAPLTAQPPQSTQPVQSAPQPTFQSDTAPQPQLQQLAASLQPPQLPQSTPALQIQPQPSQLTQSSPVKPKSNKPIIYTIAGVLTATVVVVAATLAMLLLSGKDYADVIAAIDGVKGVAYSKEVKVGVDTYGITSVQMEKIKVFFTETNKSPDETLFNAAKSPEDGLARYKAAMDKLSANRAISGDKNLAQKFATTKSIYDQFNRHATAATKYFTLCAADITDVEKGFTDYTSGTLEQYNHIAAAVSRINDKVSDLDSGDEKFDKIVQDSVGSLNKFMQHIVEYGKVHPKIDEELFDKAGMRAAALDVAQKSVEMNKYINDTVDYRNRFVDSLAYFRDEVAKRQK